MNALQGPFITDGYWLSVADGDPRAMALFKRHYSYHEYKDGRRRTLFVGPGQKTVLLTYQCDALFVWRKFRSMDSQQGVNCAVFRNESPILSSTLILEAMKLAWQRWPAERLYTYVNPCAAGGDGQCFKIAGWRKCGRTQGRTLASGEKKDRLYILEAIP